MTTKAFSGVKVDAYRFTIGRRFYRIFVALWVTLVLNGEVFSLLSYDRWGSVGLVLFGINIALVYLLTPGRCFNAGIILLLFSSAVASFFLSTYGIVIDRSMLQNVMETDAHEATELLSLNLVMHVAVGLLPLVLLNQVKASSQGRAYKVFKYMGALSLVLIGLGATILVNYQDYAGYFRQHKQIKHLATPLNIITASVSYINNNLLKSPLPFSFIASNVVLAADANKPELLVIVLGETARADHFPINGYERNTTPRLNTKSLINFAQVSSCGTATAHSLPCMFSWQGRDNYRQTIAQSSENVFDIMQRAGVRMNWFDNNSGCKHLCDRMPSVQYWKQPQCDDGCTDDVLLQGLREFTQQVQQQGQQGVVVLHQQGSHGPAYFKRSRPQHKHFLPECKSDTFANCSESEIINAYDNSIVETDALISSVIDQLEQLPIQTAMLYVSDHGESLGENGVFLHGLPYWMAPVAQTHVPMMMWFSEQFTQAHNLDIGCLAKMGQQPTSHDMLFNGLLDMLSINYTTDKSISAGIAQCQHQS
jgi:lipid A ethanolaminephosphotransferase